MPDKLSAFTLKRGLHGAWQIMYPEPAAEFGEACIASYNSETHAKIALGILNSRIANTEELQSRFGHCDMPHHLSCPVPNRTALVQSRHLREETCRNWRTCPMVGGE